MTDVRCPVSDSRLFFRITDDGNLEVGCRNCRDRARQQDRSVLLVLHTYSPDGLLVGTQTLRGERRMTATPRAPWQSPDPPAG